MVKIKKVDWFLLIFLSILVILTVILIIFPDLGNTFNLSEWINKEHSQYDIITGFIITIFASFFGALVPFPVPYTIILALVSLKFIQHGINIGILILLILVATIVNLFGDLFDWLIGRGGSFFAERSKENKPTANINTLTSKSSIESNESIDSNGNASNINKNQTENQLDRVKVYKNRWEKLIYSKSKLIPAILFLFGLTPLPDSLIYVPLGVVKYPLYKIVIWNGLGKLFMMLACSIAGIFVFDWFFNIMGGSSGQYGWVSGMVVLYISWLIMFIMLKFK